MRSSHGFGIWVLVLLLPVSSRWRRFWSGPSPDARLRSESFRIKASCTRKSVTRMLWPWIGLWVVFGHASPALIAAAVAVALAVDLFVVFYEEPTLRGKFGADYEEYCDNVDRWWPRVRGWDRQQ